ncbi:MotA/TolQ/ExbB proton channel family protein [Pontibacterium granulatum]|uniref:MotA/TolQ/ExbB proton channel family protein n=1 Tax=Pontibacterium granulatum TaxID=2036029 RepID=UPI00249C98C3|nr:MotA/TolQ/ExbB proton channel family protein [Pontibacterium granulatum]MDI3324532.1 MotA/TolQ/ExbB proton channel family protein [Pontibacterium granulatum]
MIKQMVIGGLLGAGAVVVQATEVPHNLDGLLQEVRQFSSADEVVNRQREQLFDADLKQQQVLLAKSEQRLQAAATEQERLKNAFDANDLKLAEMESLIQQRAGQLGEVFGVVKEEAGELRSVLEDSLANAEYPGRADTLAFTDSKRVPSLRELETLWYQLQLEMMASGRISRFNAPVVNDDGSVTEQPVVRFGLFSAATEQGDYLSWDIQQQSLTVLPTQPDGAMPQLLAYLSGASNEIQIDPTRGQLFRLLDRQPKLFERVQQGGEVGYMILALGALGLLVAVLQMLNMLYSEVKVRAQLNRADRLSQDNALGRVLLAVTKHNLTQEQRELKVDEAILQELPGIERGQSFVKLLAAVAPLLGLLGTVIGMIATFQSITLYGTSDPKLMAGGISQALITTVLGLVVAIPLLFCHSYLAARGRRMTQILQEKSLGLLADTQPAHMDEVFERAA